MFFFPLWSLFKKAKRELETRYKLGSALCLLLLVSQLLAKDAQRKTTRTGQMCRARDLICHSCLLWPASSILQEWQLEPLCLVAHDRLTLHELVWLFFDLTWKFCCPLTKWSDEFHRWPIWVTWWFYRLLQCSPCKHHFYRLGVLLYLTPLQTSIMSASCTVIFPVLPWLIGPSDMYTV